MVLAQLHLVIFDALAETLWSCLAFLERVEVLQAVDAYCKDSPCCIQGTLMCGLQLFILCIDSLLSPLLYILAVKEGVDFWYLNFCLQRLFLDGVLFGICFLAQYLFFLLKLREGLLIIVKS